MAAKLTIVQLSTLTGISQAELKDILKEKGVSVEADQALTPEQIQIIKGMKKRDTVSVKQSVTAPKAKTGQTVITRLQPQSKPSKLTLSPSIGKKIPPKPVVEPVTETPKPEPAKPDELKSTNEKQKPAKQHTDKKPEKPIYPKKEEEKEFFNDPIPKPKVIKTDVAAVSIGEETSLHELAQKTHLSETELAQVFFNNGYMVKKNDPIDFETAALLLETLNVTLEKVIKEKVAPGKLSAQHEGTSSTRPPVVAIMGHVDHGKTSLLDYIRSTKVAAKEAGGITQHIGAYQVKTCRGMITFLDTPGHEAFSAMRGRGANVTDIIVLIIAANDGLKPQTIESIQHAKSTDTPIVVAITKKDIAEPGSVEQVISELASHEIVAEAWGGGVAVAEVSSKTGEGIDELLELISLQAEIMELTAFTAGQVSARVCEARIDRGRGAVITLIIESGTLKIGDILNIGPGSGKVRTMVDSSNKRLKEAGPSTPVEITGISPLPSAGDQAVSYPDEKSARQAASEFITDNSNAKSKSALTLDDLFNQKPDTLQLSVIVKADTHGSLEAITDVLNNIEVEDTELTIVDAQVGSINSSDVTLAANTNAELISFHVNIESTAKKLLEQHSITAHQFKTIYQLIDHTTQSLVKLKGPVMKETNIGFANVKAVFRSSKFGQIAGCIVTEGIIKRGSNVRVTRKGEVVFDGELVSLKREKENLTSARKNTECGLGIKNFSEAKVGDVVECYILEEDV